MNRRSVPLASIFALLLIGLAWVYLLGSETPRGQVQGVTLLTDANGKSLPHCDVFLTPVTKEDGDESPTKGLPGATLPGKDARERRHAISDPAGHFLLRNVPAGAYTLSASAHWHSTSDVAVTIEEGKTASADLKLSRSEPDLSISDHQGTFTTAERPFLPIRGYVALQAQKGKVVPSAVRVKVWRTRLSDVLRRDDAAQDLSQLGNTYNGSHSALSNALLHPDPSLAPAPQLVTDTTVTIHNADREGFFVNRLPLTVAQGKPGLYLVKFASGKYASCSYVLVTDLALLVKRSDDQIVGYTAHLQKGTPVGGATIQVVRSGKAVATGKTSAEGLINLTLPPSATKPSDGSNEENSGLTLASYGDDEAVVTQNGSRYGGDENAGAYVVHVVTDRTVYRPGDTIQFKGIVRRHQNLPDAAPGYTVPRDIPITVEIRDAAGGLLARESHTTNASGAFSGKVETSAEGATGTYTLVTTLDGEQHTSEILIASYRKPEFAVTVTPTKPRYVRGETVELALNASYYFGAPVAGAKVHYYVYRDADWQAEYGPLKDEEESDDYARYRGDAYGSYYGESVGEGDIMLDENGKAVVRVRTDIRHPNGEEEEHPRRKKHGKEDDDESLPQSETYTLTAEVKDESERSVEAEGAATVGAGNLLLTVAPEGYVATVGKAGQVFVTVRDPQGKPVPNTPVTLTPTYEVWSKDRKESVTRPLGAPQTVATGPDGRAIFAVTPDRATEVQLTATAQDANRRTIRAESSVWASSDRSDDLDTDYGDLSLLTDKRKYAPGDTAQVLVNASRVGQTALLSVEGDRVYQTFSIPLRKHSTLIRVPVSAAWGPNVVLVANYIRDKKFASSETPLRVSLAARKLAVEVRAANGDKYHPGDSVTYMVTTKDAATGKPVPANFAFSVVDESIYALRADDPQALRRTFYPPRTNRVRTDFSFAVEYLGDVNKAEPIIKARSRFRDTAFWQPEGQTDASGTATLTVPLPDNLTTWRATANAVSDETAVGYGITKVVSSKPFFVRLETPRFLTGGDSSRLLALVHNETGEERQVNVRLVTPLLPQGASETQSLAVPAGGVGKAEWTIAASANLSGLVPMRLTAWTPKQAGKEQFTDGIEQTLPTRAYGRANFTVFAGVLDKGGYGRPEGPVPLEVAATAIPQETRLTLRVTPSVRGALGGGLDYLVGFPYGCAEQTMSRFYPDLLVQHLGLLRDARKKDDLPRMVRDGVARLARFQHSESGGWGWWEQGSDDGFMTAYVLEGLSTAQAQGYGVDKALIERGQKAAEKLATTGPLHQRPYLLYALAQSGYDDATTGILHAPFRDSSAETKLVPAQLPSDALAYLCLLGKRLGVPYPAYYHELQQRAVFEGLLVHWKPFKNKPDEYEYEADCSERMATALALRVLLAHDPNSPRIPAVLRWLMKSRTDGYWGNTRDTAWVLVALCDYLQAHPEEAAPPTGTVAVQINNRTVRTLNLATDAPGEPEILLTLPRKALREGDNELRLVRSGSAGGTVFYSGALRQTEGVSANTELSAISDNGITVKREVLRVQSHKSGDVWRLATETAADGRFAQGDRLKVRLTITAEKDLSYVLIEDGFPSGAEVTQRGTAEEEVADGSWNFWYDHVDVRDDRIAFFARKMPKGTHVLEYNLRAQTPGTSRALPTVVQGMYQANAHGESDVTPLEVQP